MPLFWLSIAFLFGIVLSRNTAVPAWVWGLIIGLGIISFILRRKISEFLERELTWFSGFQTRLAYVPIFLMIASFGLGGIRHINSLPEITPEHIAWHNDLKTSFVIEGIVVKPPDHRDSYTNLKVDIRRFHPTDDLSFKDIEGQILAVVDPYGHWNYGDRIRLTGNLETPFESEEFSYKEYLAGKGIRSIMYNPKVRRIGETEGSRVYSLIYGFRARAKEVLYKLYPEPEVSLFSGILLGDDRGMSAELMEDFNRTGTSHIIAISGFNITILSALFISLFCRLFGIRTGALITIPCLVVYTILVGADAPVVRAAIMGALSILGSQIGRRQVGINSLAFVSAVMVFFNPSIIWEAGFQLSFMATLGLVLYGEPLAQYVEDILSRRMNPTTVHRVIGPINEYFLFTLSAQLTTLPIVAYHFNRISLVSMLSNPLILPAQPGLMVFGGLSVIGGMIFLGIGRLLSYAALPFATYTIRVVEMTARLPGGSLEIGGISFIVILCFFIILFGITFFWKKIAEVRRIIKPALVVFVLGLASLFIWKTAFELPDGKLHLMMLNVGNGEALLIQSPDGRYVLINGGESPSMLSSGLGRNLPGFIGGIDFLVVAGTEKEQISSLPRVIHQYTPDNILWAGTNLGTKTTRSLQSEIARLKIPMYTAYKGQRLELGDGAVLKVLSVNSRGAVLELTYGQFRAHLPVGLDFETLDSPANQELIKPSTIYLLSSGGYSPLNPQEWIQRFHPRLWLLSIGSNTKASQISKEILDLSENGNLLRTDRHGWVHLKTDGEELWVSSQHK